MAVCGMSEACSRVAGLGKIHLPSLTRWPQVDSQCNLYENLLLRKPVSLLLQKINNYSGGPLKALNAFQNQNGQKPCGPENACCVLTKVEAVHLRLLYARPGSRQKSDRAVDLPKSQFFGQLKCSFFKLRRTSEEPERSLSAHHLCVI